MYDPVAAGKRVVNYCADQRIENQLDQGCLGRAAPNRPHAQSYQQGGDQYMGQGRGDRRALSAGGGQLPRMPRQNQARPSQYAGQDLQYRGGVRAADYYEDEEDDEGDDYLARANAGYPLQVRAP